MASAAGEWAQQHGHIGGAYHERGRVAQERAETSSSNRLIRRTRLACCTSLRDVWVLHWHVVLLYGTKQNVLFMRMRMDRTPHAHPHSDAHVCVRNKHAWNRLAANRL